MSGRSTKIGQGTQVHSIVVPGFSPSRPYGAFATGGAVVRRSDDANLELRMRAAASRFNRKVAITLPTTPFDWRSDSATSTPRAPQHPVDVRPPSLSPQTAATAAILSTDKVSS